MKTKGILRIEEREARRRRLTNNGLNRSKRSGKVSLKRKQLRQNEMLKMPQKMLKNGRLRLNVKEEMHSACLATSTTTLSLSKRYLETKKTRSDSWRFFFMDSVDSSLCNSSSMDVVIVHLHITNQAILSSTSSISTLWFQILKQSFTITSHSHQKDIQLNLKCNRLQ